MIFTWFAIPAYVHTSKLTGLEDFTKQASKASNAYNWLPRYQWTFTTRDYPQSLNPSVSQHLQYFNLILQKNYKWISLTQCVWSQMKAQCVNEWDEYKDLKPNESCMLNILLNNDRWNSPCLNYIELIYNWNWKTSCY